MCHRTLKKQKSTKICLWLLTDLRLLHLNDGETLSGLRILHFLNMVQTLILIFLKVHQRKTFLNWQLSYHNPYFFLRKKMCFWVHLLSSFCLHNFIYLFDKHLKHLPNLEILLANSGPIIIKQDIKFFHYLFLIFNIFQSKAFLEDFFRVCYFYILFLSSLSMFHIFFKLKDFMKVLGIISSFF